MTDEQGALDWFTDDSEDAEAEGNSYEGEETEDDSESSEGRVLAPEDRRGGEGCCPWCLGSAEDFVEVQQGIGCGHCDALIPTLEEWYQQDEKIVI